MLTPEMFVESLSLEERRPGEDAVPLQMLDSWRKSGLTDDEVFQNYLEQYGWSEDDLRHRLASSVPENSLSLEWVMRLEKMMAGPGAKNLSPFLPIRFNAQELSTLPFAPFYAPLIVWAQDRLKSELSGAVIHEAAARQVVSAVLARGLDVSLRCLLEHFSASRQTKGTTYEEFASLLSEESFRHELLRAYPLMARDLMRAMEQAVGLFAEVLLQFAHDLPHLKHRGLVPPETTKIHGFFSDAGDLHRNGRSVCLLSFEDGARLVYRPHDIGTYEFYAAVTDQMTKAGAPLIGLKTLNCGDHGWVEFAEAMSGRPDRRLFAAYGRLAATAWWLGSTDLHMENVIATAQGPVPVDLETVLGSTASLRDDATANERAVRELNDGPLGTGILPVSAGVAAAESMEVSALCGGLRPVDGQVEMLVDNGTDAIRLERQSGISGRRTNMPELTTLEDVAGFSPDVLDGFEAGLKVASTNRAALVETLIEAPPFEVRTVLRPTRLYSVLLTQAKHPQYLRSGLARDHLFNRLWGKVEPTISSYDVVLDEVRQLWSGDIPWFAVPSTQHHIVSGKGQVLQHGLAHSPVERAVERIGPRANSTWPASTLLVRDALASVRPVAEDLAEVLIPQDRQPAGTKVSPGILEEFMDRLLQKYANQAILGADDVTWVGTCSTPDGSGIRLQPLGTGLFDGLAGVGLALTTAAAAVDEPVAKALAIRSLHPVGKELERWCDAPLGPIGAHSGAGGLAFAMATAVEHLPDAPGWWRDACARYVQVTARQVTDDSYLDVSSGAAGALAVGCALVESGTLAESDVQPLARTCVAYLSNRATAVEGTDAVAWPTGDARVALGGFSHGASGIAWALSRAAHLMEDPDAAHALAMKGLAFDDTLLDPDVGLWQDARPEWSTSRAYPIQWCHGAAGILLARAHVARWSGSVAAAALTEQAAKAVLTKQLPSSDCLCHGGVGNALCLTESFPGDASSQYMDEALSRILEGTFRHGLGLDVESVPGLMVGHAGLLHALALQVKPTLSSALWLGTRVPVSSVPASS